MTRGQVLTAVTNFLENRLQKLTLDPWLDIETASIVHRKRAWWRKKSFTFPTVAGQANYDLSSVAGASPAADPYLEQIVRMNWVQAVNNTHKMNYVENVDDVQIALDTNTQDQPINFYFVPGSTQQIGLSPIPNAVYTLRVLYWQGFVSPAVYDDTLPIPIIPVQYHYLTQLMLLKRCCLYLFGQNDPRYTTLKDELEGSDGMGGLLGDLDRFSSISVESVDEWRSTDTRDFVQSTGV